MDGWLLSSLWLEAIAHGACGAALRPLRLLGFGCFWGSLLSMLFVRAALFLCLGGFCSFALVALALAELLCATGTGGVELRVILAVTRLLDCLLYTSRCV